MWRVKRSLKKKGILTQRRQPMSVHRTSVRRTACSSSAHLLWSARRHVDHRVRRTEGTHVGFSRHLMSAIRGRRRVPPTTPHPRCIPQTSLVSSHRAIRQALARFERRTANFVTRDAGVVSHIEDRAFGESQKYIVRPSRLKQCYGG